MKLFYKFTAIVVAVFVLNSANAQLITLEDFEDPGPFPWGAWTGTGTIVTSDAISGVQSFDTGGSWPYRTDFSYGVMGDTLSCWTKVGTGRTYWGFGASAAGCYSFVAAPNTGDIRFQQNDAFGYAELTSTPYSFTTGAWYRMEIIFVTDTDLIGNLYSADGVTLVATVSQTLPAITPGGFAFRTFGGNTVDLLQATGLPCTPVYGAGVETVTACGSYTVPSGDETYTSSGVYEDTLYSVAATCDSIITIDLTIVPVDDPTFDYAASSYCMNETNPLANISGTSGGTFSSSSTDLVVDPSTGEIDFSSSLAGSYTIEYLTGGTCPDSMEFSIELFAAPTVTATVSQDTICFGNSAVFTGTGADTYTWDLGVTDGVDFTPASLGYDDYTVIGTDVNGCEDTDVVGLMVVDNDLVASNTTTLETAGADGTIDLTVSGGTPAYSFDWDNDGTGDFDDTEDLSGLTPGVYIVVVEDTYGCTTIDTAVVSSQLNVLDSDGISISVYPNPTQNFINISVGGETFNYVITNELGQEVARKEIVTEEKFDFSLLPAGNYFITVSVNDITKTINIVKQ